MGQCFTVRNAYIQSFFVLFYSFLLLLPYLIFVASFVFNILYNNFRNNDCTMYSRTGGPGIPVR